MFVDASTANLKFRNSLLCRNFGDWLPDKLIRPRPQSGPHQWPNPVNPMALPGPRH